MDWTGLGKQVLASQPFSVFLGVELVRLEPGEAELALAIWPEFRQQHGAVHGGVLSYLMDNALTLASGSALGPDVMTAEHTINSLRPADWKWSTRAANWPWFRANSTRRARTASASWWP